MMAFERSEPFGTFPMMDGFGAICASIYNVKRSKDTDRVWKSTDFFPLLARELGIKNEPEGPILLGDPEEQAKLIKQRIFGMKV